MKYLVSVTFVPGQQEAIAALMPAEQAHVTKLLEQGVIFCNTIRYDIET